MAEIHRYDSARLQRPRHRDVGQRTLHSQPAGAYLHSARHTMREAAAEESQRPSSDYAGGHCAHRDATQKKQNRLRSVTPKPILQRFLTFKKSCNSDTYVMRASSIASKNRV